LRSSELASGWCLIGSGFGDWIGITRIDVKHTPFVPPTRTGGFFIFDDYCANLDVKHTRSFLRRELAAAMGVHGVNSFEREFSRLLDCQLKAAVGQRKEMLKKRFVGNQKDAGGCGLASAPYFWTALFSSLN
jgi:hypothetical protein